MESSNPKVVVIGIDGASFDLVDEWSKGGKLRNLHKLIHNGAFGELLSTILPISATAWASFMTGMNPGKHGVFDFISRKANSYEFAPATCPPHQENILWNLIGTSGKKSIIVNVPMTYPPRINNGILISGYPALELRRDYAYPRSILNEIKHAVGNYFVHYGIEFTGSNGRQFLEHLKSMAEMRTAAAKYLMESKEWDFFMVNFQVIDLVQHLFWKYFDQSHPEFNSSPGYMKNAILDMYQCVDQQVGELLDDLDEETYKFVISDHGFGPLCRVVYLNNFLEQVGLLKYRRSIKYFLFRGGFTGENVYKMIAKLGLGNLIPRFRGRKFEAFKLFLGPSDIDWRKTKVFSVGHNGQLYINLAGREPLGIVRKGPEYEAVRKQIIEILRRFVDPETKEKIFDGIYLREQIYDGSYLDAAPDIVGLMTRYTQELNYNSTKIVGKAPDLLSGYHRMKGIFIASGPKLKKAIEVHNLSIVDVAPTILYLLRIPIPTIMDGHIAKEILLTEFIERREPVYSSMLLREKIRRRLKNLKREIDARVRQTGRMQPRSKKEIERILNCLDASASLKNLP